MQVAVLLRKLLSNSANIPVACAVHVCGGDFFVHGDGAGMESLSHSDSMIEFISRTIFYLKQQVHKKLTYTQKLHFHRKVHILHAALRLADCLVHETCQNLEKIFNKNTCACAVPCIFRLCASSRVHLFHIILHFWLQRNSLRCC